MPTRLALHVLLAAFHVVRGSVWAREDRGLSASTDVGDDSEDWFEEMLGRRVAVPRSFKASPMTLGASQAGLFVLDQVVCLWYSLVNETGALMTTCVTKVVNDIL